jgi:type I restriction enzyme S subunit
MGIAGIPMCSNQGLKSLVPHSNVCSRYLYHALRANISGLIALGRGATFKEVSKAVVEEYNLPFPDDNSLQEGIADILDKADGVRRKREEALKLSDELLRSVFLEMFGDPVTNPKGWPVRALKVLGRVTTGTTPPSAEEGMFDGNIPFITPGDLKETWVKTSRTVTEKGALKARTISKGATLVCCIGATIGKMGKAAQLSAFNQQINAIEWGEQVNADYGLETLKFFKKAIAQRGSATTLPILNKSAFQQLEIPVASEVNQRQFSEVVEVIDQMRTNATETLFQTQSLFSSLQQRVFSGQL